MLGHMMNRFTAFPLGEVFEPCYQMEDSIEHFFSLVKGIKREVKGTPTVANSISGATLLHERQRRAPAEVRSHSLYVVDGFAGSLALLNQ